MSDIQLRRFTPDDLPRAFDLSNAAGSQITLAYWTRILRLAGDACYCLTDGDLFVSTAVALAYGRERGWIALVFTRPEYRRQGLAARVTQAALDDLQARVERVFLDASPLGRPIYVQMGFSELFAIDVYEGQASPHPLAPSPSGRGEKGQSGVRLVTADDLDAVIRLDAESFGVARPNVFRGLVREFPTMAWVDEDSGTIMRGAISGYVLARETRAGAQIGPMMHNTPEGAERLLQTALRALQGKQVRLDTPVPNAAAGQFARQIGLETHVHTTRMIYGPIPAGLNAGERQYAAGSPSTG